MTYDWIAFLTDYGYRDGFVAACHGVIARIAPQARVIDVTHAVPPQDVRHGAVVLAQTAPYLPACVVIGVVDPGVGSARRGIAAVAGEQVLVGPDNGLLPWAGDALGGISAAVELRAAEYRLAGNAATFHGRDVFAPAAAHVAAGVPVTSLGPELAVDELIRLPDPVVRVRAGVVDTEIHLIDHFGNVALAARGEDLATAGITIGDRISVVIGSGDDATRSVDAVVGRIFADVAAGEPVLYIDSYGYAALAVNQGSAVSLLDASPGRGVRLHLR